MLWDTGILAAMMPISTRISNWTRNIRAVSLVLMILICVSVAIRPSVAQSDFQANMQADVRIDHSAWNELLGAYSNMAPDGVVRFDYADVSARDRQRLETYLDALAAIDITAADKATAMAYWINFYNALTVKTVLDHYPVQSIRQIRPSFFSIGPWKKKWVTVGDEDLSLDDIEHIKLRGQFPDARIHYVVNCASWGCPNLAQRAYTADNLEAQLDQAARDYINHPRGAFVSADGDLTISSIYKWYREDFGSTDAEVIQHLRAYADQPLSTALEGVTRIDGYDYDWTLNAPEYEKGAY